MQQADCVRHGICKRFAAVCLLSTLLLTPLVEQTRLLKGHHLQAHCMIASEMYTQQVLLMLAGYAQAQIAYRAMYCQSSDLARHRHTSS